MKATSYVVVLFSVIFTLTAPAKSDTNGYLGVNAGLHIGENFQVEGSRMGLAYGRDVSTNRYLGSFEIGLAGLDNDRGFNNAVALPLTYHYRFMRENKLISFGWNATLQVVAIDIKEDDVASSAVITGKGTKTSEKSEVKDKKDGLFLGIGGGVAVFAQTYITQSISVLLQVGVEAYAPLAHMDSPIGPVPYTSSHVRYYY